MSRLGGGDETTTTQQPTKKPVTRKQLLLGLMWLFAIVLFIAGAGLASHLSSAVTTNVHRV